MHVPNLDLSIEEIKAELDRIRNPVRVAIYRARNPFNVGAIIRVAHSFLVKEIILIGNEKYYDRAAMGMNKYENILELDTEETFLNKAKTEGWHLSVFEKDFAEVSMWDAKLPRDTVLVFGSENHGCSQALVDAADERVGIPMFGINHSYPLSVAAGMAMCEWARRHCHTPRVLLPSAEGANFVPLLSEA